MVVALVVAALVVPKLLPGTIQNSESLLGRNKGIAFVPLNGPPAREFVPAPPKGEAYTAWSTSESREEVVVGWSHSSKGKVDNVKVQSRSAFSGRLQAEWAVQIKEPNPQISQIGFLPRRNQIWFLASGTMQMVDIKSGAVLDYPFKGPGGSGSVPAPQDATWASFSPVTGMLAYAEDRALTLVTGLATGRDGKPLKSQKILVPGATRDNRGQVIQGAVDSFDWIDDDTLAVIVARGSGTSPTTTVYFVDVRGELASSIAVAVPPPANGWFASISGAPVGSDFIVLEDLAGATGGARIKKAVAVYDEHGKAIKRIELPAADWQPPISWSSP